MEGNHEAIIPKDIFLRVQEELVRRRVVNTSANGKKRSYSCNHCFAQIVICGECGEMFRRIHWNNRGCKSIVWRCISRLEPTGQECHARTVNETVLENVVVQAINTLLGDKSTYQAQLQQNIAKVIRSAQQNTADGIDERLQELQKELLKKANNKEAYDEIADEIFKLREQREKCKVDTAARNAQIARINELQDFIKQQPVHLEAFDEALVKRWLDVLRTGKFNHRLLSELICHKDFQRLMLDAEIYVDRIADMRIKDMNTVLEATRQMVLMEHGEEASDLYLHTLKAAKIQEEEYFGHLVTDDLSNILRDIRKEHRTDTLTADDDLSAAAVQKQLMEAVHFEGSSEEKKIRAYLATLGIDYDTLTKEEFVSLIGILKKSKHMKSPISQRGKTAMTHGKGKRKKR